MQVLVRASFGSCWFQFMPVLVHTDSPKSVQNLEDVKTVAQDAHKSQKSFKMTRSLKKAHYAQKRKSSTIGPQKHFEGLSLAPSYS